ncbi:MAG: hypothetical protein E4H14_05700 [Candidatus Thorarchaeota archaeon]|nr:MAG: hypothetical protein E4H14_05700 [Candidatus Thorarchaeota archaeon]
MGMKEKPREKTKEEVRPEVVETEVEPESEEDTEQVEIETHTPEVEIEPAIVKTTEIVEEVYTNSTETIVESTTEAILMPSWGGNDQSEWMYGIPPREEDRNLWEGEWADFLLQWTEHNSVHVLSLATFIAEPPFKDLRNKVDSFKEIANVLIDKEVAEWTDRKKRQLRVYWKPLEDWADILYECALKTGKLRLDGKSIIIQESGESFAKLPEKDLYIVLALMVEKEFAEWVDKKRGAVLVIT